MTDLVSYKYAKFVKIFLIDKTAEFCSRTKFAELVTSGEDVLLFLFLRKSFYVWDYDIM